MKKILFFLFLTCIVEAQGISSNLIRAYASIYTHENSSVQSMQDSVFIKVTAYTNNGLSYNCIADADSDRIEILQSGDYSLNSNFSTKASVAGVTFITVFCVDNIEIPDVYTERRWINANDNSSAAMSCQYHLHKGQHIEIWARHNHSSAVNITVTSANLNITYIGAGN